MRVVSTALVGEVPTCREGQALRARRAAVDRRAVAARRVARLLLPGAERAGGFTSAQLRVHPGGMPPARPPDAVLVLAETPADGLLLRAPALACFVDVGGAAPPVDADFWLRRGCLAVWQVGVSDVRVWTGAGHTAVRVPDLLELALPPSPVSLRLPVADVLDAR